MHGTTRVVRRKSAAKAAAWQSGCQQRARLIHTWRRARLRV